MTIPAISEKGGVMSEPEQERVREAAPELLEALEWAVRQIELFEGDFCEPNARASQRLIEARTAIRKARGE